jgi:hypothetical protein
MIAKWGVNRMQTQNWYNFFCFFLDELVRIFNANTKNYTNHSGLKTKEQRKHYAITNPYTIV